MWRTFLLVATLTFTGPALAAGGGPPVRPAYNDATPRAIASARQYIERQEWDQALQVLETARRRDPGNADLWNWTGYAERQRGKLPQAFSAYDEALRLDPGHLGAREYLGEAWLMDGQPEKAEALLAELKALCGACDEERDLAAAIDRYRGQQPENQPGY
ncbi:hypothetical protein JHS3_16320 [Jeongeupia sp. HS-3]|uniref:tetratricopeptide repeat protein n=1 Tax=Jeongeupia sp. HS-3 TaxID=1009682 RepID=UPI0018A5BA47|nr:tetratricopeptide repeat protein [Jeongeupia sp. HS-3]BCL75896.1 hypothetical protein JHS3_16320 [Jeongeupia sp. HS-3]